MCAESVRTIISKIISPFSISTVTLVGFGLLNYRWVFSAGRFLQSAVASDSSNPQLGGPVIRKLQLPPPGASHVWNDASEPQQRKVELWARNCREFCRKWQLPRNFWVLLYAVNLRHGTDGFTSPPKEGVLRIFSPEKSDGFGRIKNYISEVKRHGWACYCLEVFFISKSSNCTDEITKFEPRTCQKLNRLLWKTLLINSKTLVWYIAMEKTDSVWCWRKRMRVSSLQSVHSTSHKGSKRFAVLPSKGREFK